MHGYGVRGQLGRGVHRLLSSAHLTQVVKPWHQTLYLLRWPLTVFYYYVSCIYFVWRLEDSLLDWSRFSLQYLGPGARAGKGWQGLCWASSLLLLMS